MPRPLYYGSPTLVLPPYLQPALLHGLISHRELTLARRRARRRGVAPPQQLRVRRRERRRVRRRGLAALRALALEHAARHRQLSGDRLGHGLRLLQRGQLGTAHLVRRRCKAWAGSRWYAIGSWRWIVWRKRKLQVTL